MTTLRDILLTTPLPQLHTSFEKAPGAASPSLSQKSWAKDYHDVKVEAIKNPTPAHMADLLGPETNWTIISLACPCTLST